MDIKILLIIGAVGFVFFFFVVKLLFRRSDSDIGLSSRIAPTRKIVWKKLPATPANRNFARKSDSVKVMFESEATLPKPTVYKTEAVKRIVKDLGMYFHRDYPFLDASYSPSSCMPVGDLTMYVAEMHDKRDVTALRELWSFIGGDAERLLLEKCLKLEKPKGFDISDDGWHEVWAINALMCRMGRDYHATHAAARMLSTTLASRNISCTQELKEALKDGMRGELVALQKKGLFSADIDQTIGEAIRSIDTGVGGFDDFAKLMRSVAPTVRLTLADSALSSCNSTWSMKLHWELGYGERCYGCCEEYNRKVGESLGVLEPYDPSEYGVPSSITKAMISESLIERGVVFKKSMKRDDLLRLAWQEKGLVVKIIEKNDPAFKTFKREFQSVASAWASRNKLLFYISMALLKCMQAEMLYMKFPDNDEWKLDC